MKKERSALIQSRHEIQNQINRDRQYFIQPGMEVTADIIAGEETVLTFALGKARLLTDF